MLEPTTTGWEYRAKRTMIKTGSDSRKYQKEFKGNKVLATTQTGHHTGNENRASGAIRTMRVFGVYGLVCAGMYSFGGFWFSSDKASRTPSEYNLYALPHRRNATATTETTYNNATSRRRRRKSTNFCKPTALKGTQSNFLHRHKCKGLILPTG